MKALPFVGRTRRFPRRATAGRPWILLALVLGGLALLATPVVAEDAQPVPVVEVCPVPLDPTPVAPFSEPGDFFSLEGDYHWIHSDTHLQGNPSHEKWAWGFFLPAANSPAPLFRSFRTVVIVNNPDPVNVVSAAIEYRDLAGNLLQVNAHVIGPEGTVTEPALPLSLGNGLGSIRVVSDDNPFVGATIHHSYRFNGVLDVEPRAPSGAENPGLASMQQLQDVDNAATRIYGGPFPTTSTAAATHVFLRGNLPTFQLINPNAVQNTVSISLFGAISGAVIGPYAVTLQPFGSYIDLTLLNGLFNPATNTYASPVHDDWIAVVGSSDGLPVLGEQLMLDFYDNSMTAFTRFRMVSAMMATKAPQTLLSPELTYTTSGLPVHTIAAIGNVSSQDIGPVVIEYRDARTGTLVTDTLTTFPPGASQRIAPFEPNILNYPMGTWDGNIRIRACEPGLIGWTAREVEPDSDSITQQFRKAYGEALDGANLTEPGRSFPVTVQGQDMLRKVAPLDRCARFGDSPPWWPSYTTFANLSVGNVGPYFYRFFDLPGADVTNYFFPQPFGGVPFGFNSFTFEDGVTNRLCSPGAFNTRNTSGRVDHSSGTVIGIDAIGDPLWEWEIQIPPPVYTGPGDVVPVE